MCRLAITLTDRTFFRHTRAVAPLPFTWTARGYRQFRHKHTGILLGINLARSDNFRVGRTDRWAVEGAEERRRQSDLDGKEHFCFSG